MQFRRKPPTSKYIIQIVEYSKANTALFPANYYVDTFFYIQ